MALWLQRCTDLHVRFTRGLEPVILGVSPPSVFNLRVPSSAFENRLAEVGFAVRSKTVRSRERKGERHTIFLGTRG